MRAIHFCYTDEDLLLIYTPYEGTAWLIDKLLYCKEAYAKNEEGINHHRVGKIFNVTKFDLLTYDEKTAVFHIGTLIDDYYYVDRGFLSDKYNLFIDKNNKISFNFIDNGVGPFINILDSIYELTEKDIIIGNKEGELSLEVFSSILCKFPTRIELEHYKHARIQALLAPDLQTVQDHQVKLEKYIKKREALTSSDFSELDDKEYEIEKYEYILSKMRYMVANPGLYSESNWKKEILKIVLLLYPQYIRAFTEVSLPKNIDSYGRRVDFLLVNQLGFVDVIEIKKPESNIISSKTVRNNYVPIKKLSDTVMQIEKYLFGLNRWGREGEETILRKRRDKLPSSITIRIANPKGIIIQGREENLDDDQKMDLEIIKRHYSNIVQIMTYDDMIGRLERSIESMKNGPFIN